MKKTTMNPAGAVPGTAKKTAPSNVIQFPVHANTPHCSDSDSDCRLVRNENGMIDLNEMLTGGRSGFMVFDNGREMWIENDEGAVIWRIIEVWREN